MRNVEKQPNEQRPEPMAIQAGGSNWLFGDCSEALLRLCNHIGSTWFSQKSMKRAQTDQREWEDYGRWRSTTPTGHAAMATLLRGYNCHG